MSAAKQLVPGQPVRVLKGGHIRRGFDARVRCDHTTTVTVWSDHGFRTVPREQIRVKRAKP